MDWSLNYNRTQLSLYDSNLFMNEYIFIFTVVGLHFVISTILH